MDAKRPERLWKHGRLRTAEKVIYFVQTYYWKKGETSDLRTMNDECRR